MLIKLYEMLLFLSNMTSSGNMRTLQKSVPIVFPSTYYGLTGGMSSTSYDIKTTVMGSFASQSKMFFL